MRRPSELAPIPKPIVNLTLTSQSRAARPAQSRAGGMDAAKPVLQNNQGNARAQKRDRYVPPSGRGVEAVPGHEASVEPGIFRILGRQARRRARPRPQRDRARCGARTARRHLRAVLRPISRLSVSGGRNAGLRPARLRPQGPAFSALFARTPPRDRGSSSPSYRRGSPHHRDGAGRPAHLELLLLPFNTRAHANQPDRAAGAAQ